MFLGCSGLVFLVLLATAFAWDCARVVTNSYMMVVAAEMELKNQEERVITALAGNAVSSNQLTRILADYRASASSEERERLFNGILAESARLESAHLGGAARLGGGTADVNDPIRRRAADEVAGAQNRRMISLRHYQEAIADYNLTAGGLRGRLGVALAGIPARK